MAEHFEGAGLDGVIAKWRTSPTCRATRDAESEARAHRRLRGGRLSVAQDGAARSGRSCSGSTTTTPCCITSARPLRSTMRRARNLREWQPLRDHALRPPLGRMGQRGERRRTAANARRCRADGTRARTCRGSRCGSSACARCATTTCSAIASATRPSSCVGARQAPFACRYDQLEVTPPYELAQVLVGPLMRCVRITRSL